MEHSRLLKFLLPERDIVKMAAESVKIKFNYRSPENVEAEVPETQKIREVNEQASNGQNSLHDSVNSLNDNENSQNDGKSSKVSNENLTVASNDDFSLEPVIVVTKKEATFTKGDLKLQKVTVTEDISVNYQHLFKKQTMPGKTVDDVENGERAPRPSPSDTSSVDDEDAVMTRHRRVITGKRNGIHGTPVLLEDKHDEKRSKTRIPVSKFRQTVERVKAERRASKDKMEHEPHIPVRRTSIPKPVKDQKLATTVKKEVTITKTQERKESSNPTVTKTVLTQETVEPEDEFDKIYAEIVTTPNEVLFDDSLLNPKIEDPEKLESKFEEIIHDYDEHKSEPLDVEVVRRSKIPFLKRRSQQDIELNAQAERTSKIIAARDKLRLRRNSSTKNKSFEDELDKELKNTRENFTNSTNDSNKKEDPATVTKREVREEKISSKTPNSETEITKQFTKTESITSSKENEYLGSSSNVETISVKEITTRECNDRTENKQHSMTEENIVKSSVKIGIPAFNSYVHEFSGNNESIKTVEVKSVISYSSKEEDFVINNNIENEFIKSTNKSVEVSTEMTKDVKSEAKRSESKIIDSPISKGNKKDIFTKYSENSIKSETSISEISDTKNDTIVVGRQTSNDSTSEIKYSENTDSKNLILTSHRNDVNIKHSDIDKNESYVINLNKEVTNSDKTNAEEVVQIRNKAGASKTDSKELIEIETNKRESINELTKKKSVLSKIAMFERKETVDSIKTTTPRRGIKPPNLLIKDTKVDHVHVHTPLIVQEVIKPFQTDIDLNTKTITEEKSEKSYTSNIIEAEHITVESPVHYTVESPVHYTVKTPNQYTVETFNNYTVETPDQYTVETSNNYTVETPDQYTVETIIQESDINEYTLDQANIDCENTEENVEVAVPDMQSSRKIDDLPMTPTKVFKETEQKDKTRNIKTTKLSLTKEIQAPVIIPGFKPVSELLRSFESKREAHKSQLKRNVSKVEYRSTVEVKPARQISLAVESPIMNTEVIQVRDNIVSTSEISHTEASNNETYDGFELINDYKSLDDVFSRESDYYKLKLRQEEDMRRAKSLVELDLGDAVKGKVNNILTRMTSVNRIELERKEVISKKEMPRKRSVSEKIALFESKVTPSRSESPALRIFKSEKTLFGASRTEQKIETSRTERSYRHTREVETEKSVESTEKIVEAERSDKTDQEQIQKKIEDLNNAKLKYGKVENMSTINLSNGMKMPVLAVGTALVDPQLTYHVIAAAIDLGYRAIDSAYIYGNEQQVGNAIRDKIADGTVKREELFIINKLWSNYHRTDLVEGACRSSLQAMGLDYFDLYLVHNPMSFKEGGAPIPKIATVIQYSEHDYLDAWFGMEHLVTKGLVRAIGVSNFNSVQLQRVLDKGRIKPVVNQVECHPYLSQERLDHFCSERKVTLSCFGTLGSKGTPAEYKSGNPAVIDDALVQVMASGLGITPAQLLVRYQLENGHGVVVKSSSLAHLWDNLQALNVQLTMGQVEALHALNRNKRTYVFKGMGDTHKNYPFNLAF